MPRNVLIATSHVDIANSLRLGLEVSDHYKPQIAKSGLEAVSRVQEGEYDLIILDSEMTEDLLVAAWRNVCQSDCGPKLVVIGRGKQQNPEVLDQLQPANFFHYPVYLPEFLDYLDDLLTMKPTSPSFSFENRQPISTPTLPWLGSYEVASHHLQEQFFATSADAALIYLSGVVCALAGSLDKVSAFQIAELLLAHWDEENPADLARFVTIGDEKQEYFLYATLLNGSSVLCCLFAPDVSLSQSRAHTHELRRNLLSNQPVLPDLPPASIQSEEIIPDLEPEGAGPFVDEFPASFTSQEEVALPDTAVSTPEPEPASDKAVTLDQTFPSELDHSEEEEIEPLTLAELFESSQPDLDQTESLAAVDLSAMLEEMPSPDPEPDYAEATDEGQPESFDDIGLVFPWEVESQSPQSSAAESPNNPPSAEPEPFATFAPEEEFLPEPALLNIEEPSFNEDEEEIFAEILAQAEENDFVPPLEEEEQEEEEKAFSSLEPETWVSEQTIPSFDQNEWTTEEPESSFESEEREAGMDFEPQGLFAELLAQQSATPETDDFFTLEEEQKDQFWRQDTQPVRVKSASIQAEAEFVGEPSPEIAAFSQAATSPLKRLQRVLEDQNGLEDTQPIRIKPQSNEPEIAEDQLDLHFPWEVEPTLPEETEDKLEADIPSPFPMLDFSEPEVPPFDLSEFRDENDDLALYEEDDALFTVVLTPQNERHTLEGRLAENMEEWIKEVCEAHQWELRAISVHPSYVQMTILAQPTMTSAFVINTLRNHTSRRMFNNHPNVKKELRSDDFWAASHLVYQGDQLIEFGELIEFVEKAQKDQNNWFDTHS